MSINREKRKCLTAARIELATSVHVTSPHALPSKLHGQPDFKTVNYDFLSAEFGKHN